MSTSADGPNLATHRAGGGVGESVADLRPDAVLDPLRQRWRREEWEALAVRARKPRDASQVPSVRESNAPPQASPPLPTAGSATWSLRLARDRAAQRARWRRHAVGVACQLVVEAGGDTDALPRHSVARSPLGPVHARRARLRALLREEEQAIEATRANHPGDGREGATLDEEVLLEREERALGQRARAQRAAATAMPTEDEIQAAAAYATDKASRRVAAAVSATDGRDARAEDARSGTLATLASHAHEGQREASAVEMGTSYLLQRVQAVREEAAFAEQAARTVQAALQAGERGSATSPARHASAGASGSPPRLSRSRDTDAGSRLRLQAAGGSGAAGADAKADAELALLLPGSQSAIQPLAPLPAEALLRLERFRRENHGRGIW